ncbi:uncharacterized protein DUF481 [Gelidibacter algens]|uniref:Uncharacterized protein DUF481 n=1 Tax=Gelidibacter algens TaxID=49280 RepID=A0A1A7R1I4_9FLAO|nr:DUF481 domain-containing protein [Gelidibacter algens]OBX24637.1 hypothetical protein A9996_13990 [Gelidibacter algens]RAJ20800.1 uncharacterized protein DUF481 [Gelidibacter algens]
MKQIIFLFFLLIYGYAQSQVINVETLRKKTDSAKWTGSVSLDASLIKNKNSIFKIANTADVQYNNKKELWLFINDLKFEKAAGESFVNKGTQHLRYNHSVTETIKMEAFVQAQYDAISEIDFRGLIGTGPRFKLSSNEDYRFYLGTLIMYEYEQASEVEDNKTRKDIRGSAYVSFSIYPTESIGIISTSYYQPRVDALKDYRLSSTTSILFKIWENLAFKTTFIYNFDAYPVITIPKAQYELTNGLLFTF